jgi:class 3 adenylate cyclase
MGQIKSALELALERTSDIAADKSGLEARENKEAGMRLYAWLENGDGEKVQRFLDEHEGDARRTALEGFMDVLLTRIALPSSEHSLDEIPVIEKALEILFPGQKAVAVIPGQIRQFFEAYLADRNRLVEALTERFEPMLREKEQKLAQQTGQRVRLRPEMDPEFNKALQANLDSMNEQYAQVIDKVRGELREKFRGGEPISAENPSARLRQGERRRITVLFADLVDSTAIAESMDPEDADDMLSRLFSRFESVIDDHEGSVEKYIGDAMVAVFGVPVIHEDDADRAVFSAQAILQELGTMKLAALIPEGLSLRIGIHSGLITTGRRGEYNVVTGVTMNIAARLQELADPGDFLISGETAALCSDDVHIDRGRSVRIRGVEEAVIVHRVVPGDRGLTGSRIFVGRDELIREIRKNYFQPHTRENRGFLITGEPGIGKTELARQAVLAIGDADDGEQPVLFSRARRFRRVPYVVIVDFISNYFDLNRGMSDAQIVQAMCNRSDRLSIGEKPLAARFARFFRDLSGQTLRDEAFEILNALISEILAGAGDINQVVLVIDNADATDRKSLDFIKYLLSRQEQGPMVILCEREPRAELAEWIPGLIHRELPPLSDDASAELIRRLIPDAGETLIDRLVDLGSGNPLYLRAYADYIRHRGEESLAAGASGFAGELPDSIQNLIVSRIERFNPQVRDLIMKLSVFVNFFTESDARYIQSRTDGDADMVADALRFFYAEDLLDENRGMYFFRHELVKQALYDSLLNYNKKILHGVIVDLMNTQERPHPVRIIHHLVRAERAAEAMDQLGRSRGRTYNMDFVPYLDQLNNLTGDDPVLGLDIMFMKSRILFNNGYVEPAEEVVEQMLGYALATGDRLYSAVANHILCAYNIKAGNFERGLFCGLRALQHYGLTDTSHFALHRGLVDESRDGAMAAVLNLMIQGEIRRGNFEDAERLAGELTQAGSGRYRRTVAILMDIHRGRYRSAIAHLDDLGHDEADDPELRIRYVHYLKFLTGDWEDLEDLSDGILRSEHRDALSRVRALGFKALSRWRTNADDPQVDGLMEQARFRAGQSPNEIDRIINSSILAELYRSMDRNDEAETLALGALVSAERYSAIPELFILLVILAEICWERGDRDRCAFFLADAVQMNSMGSLLRRRDRIICAYLAAMIGVDGAPPSEETTKLLEEELAELPGTAASPNPVRETRLFPDIISHLLPGV